MECKAVKMMREIRDQISRETRDMSRDELRAYYRAASRRFQAKMDATRKRLARENNAGVKKAVGA